MTVCATPQLAQHRRRPPGSITAVATASASLAIFISFAQVPADVALLEVLEVHLAALGSAFAVWHRQRAFAGEEADREAKARLAAAHIILLLVSADYLASDVTRAEADEACARHAAGSARVIPILARACVWQQHPLAKLGILPVTGNAVASSQSQDEAWTAVVTGIKSAIMNREMPTAISFDAPPPLTAPKDAILTEGEQRRPARVFLSHAEADKPIVRWLRDELLAAGHKAWLDEDEVLVGQSIPDAVQHGLQNTDFVIVCISRNWLESGWAQAELHSTIIRQFKDHQTCILPVRLEQVELPLIIRYLSCVDLYPDKQTVRHSLGRLIASIEKHVQDRNLPQVEAQISTIGHVSGIQIPRAFSESIIEPLLQITKAFDWPRSLLLYAYRETAPADWRFHFDRTPTVELMGRMILKLADAIGTATGRHPLLEFASAVLELAVLHGDAWAQTNRLLELRGWIHSGVKHRGLSTVAHDELQRRAHSIATTFGTQETHLIIAMERSDTDQFIPHAFRVIRSRGSADASTEVAEPIELDAERVYGRADLGALVAEQVNELGETNLVVELVLPLELIVECDVHRYHIPHGLLRSVPLGAAHRVIVRSWERCYECKDIWDRWEQKWRRFVTMQDCILDCVCVDRAVDVSASGNDPAVKVRSQPDIVGMAAILNAGFPIAVWPERCAEERVNECMIQMSPEPGNSDWREALRRHREHTMSDGRHVGGCIVLLWDDFDNRPPSPRTRLAGPERKNKP